MLELLGATEELLGSAEDELLGSTEYEELLGTVSLDDELSTPMLE
jgi:hypothetical protein